MTMAAMAETGRVELAGGEFYRSSVTPLEQNSASGIPAVDVLPLRAGIDLIKMDLEGSEWQILMDPRFAQLEARATALEWHRESCPAEDPREVASAALEEAGYEVAHGFSNVDCGALWA